MKRWTIIAIIAGFIIFLFIAIRFLPKKTESAQDKIAPSPSDIDLRSDYFAQGDSLYDCLQAAGLPPAVINAVVKNFSLLYDPRRLRAGNRYEIARDEQKEFLYFKYWPDPLTYYTVEKTGADTYVAKKESIQLEKSIVGIEGRIQASLWEAMVKKGVSPEVIMNFADIFAWQIDFLTEPRKDDLFRLVWERYTSEDGFVKEGNILGAFYRGKGTGGYLAIYFQGYYYDSQGKSLEKYFLKAPLNYRRISSHYSYRRFHPILKIYRPHLGIDYVAPTGTPVVSIGDGTVIHKGWKGANGNLAIIRHNNVYTSSYGHLSGYGKGIKTGVKVKQGQVIGYVGTTGLSTGPHLDFRIKKYGKFANFLQLKFPPLKSLAEKDLPSFNRIKKSILQRLSLQDNR